MLDRALRRRPAAVIRLLLALGPVLAPAEAFAFNRIYVSRSGDNAANCATVETACRDLGIAADKVDAGGTILLIGPHFVSTTLFNKGVTLVGLGDGVVVLGMGQLTFDLPDGVSATVKNVTFQNVGGLSGGGVAMTGGGKLTIQDCRFDRLSLPAVDVRGRAGARVALDGVTITNSAGGVRVKGANGAANTVFVQRSLIDANAGFALQVDGAANAAVISGSTLSGSGGPDLSLLNGGRAVSYKNNVIRSGTPTQMLPLN